MQRVMQYIDALFISFFGFFISVLFLSMALACYILVLIGGFTLFLILYKELIVFLPGYISVFLIVGVYLGITFYFINRVPGLLDILSSIPELFIDLGSKVGREIQKTEIKEKYGPYSVEYALNRTVNLKLDLSRNSESDFDKIIHQQLRKALKAKEFNEFCNLLDDVKDINYYHNATKDSVRPLIFEVAEYGELDFLKILLERGADINFVDEFRGKVTPLHAASSQGHLEIVRELVERGAKISVADQWGKTPLDYANSHHGGHQDIVDYLTMSGKN